MVSIEGVGVMELELMIFLVRLGLKILKNAMGAIRIARADDGKITLDEVSDILVDTALKSLDALGADLCDLSKLLNLPK